MKMFRLAILLAAFSLNASAQNYAVFKTFSAVNLNPANGSYTNSDGAYPVAEVIISGHTVFGVCSAGGTGGCGTIFKMNFDGTGFTNLHSFAPGSTNLLGAFTNSDGQSPRSSLLLSGGTLYGTAEYGGTLNGGTLFKIDTNGGGFTLLKTFTPTNSSGAYPAGGVILLDNNTICGTTSLGGSNSAGVIFKVLTNGASYSVIHQFDFTTTNTSQPFDTLLRSGATLYGTTYSGGSNGWGAVFKVTTNGTGFTLLKSFSALVAGTNADGARPEAQLAISGSTLYGTTYFGGVNSNGVIFRVDTNGNSFTNIHNFTATSFGFNADGTQPSSKLVLAGSLYGTAQFGGNSGGLIYAVDTDGSNFLPLRLFGTGDPTVDGRVPAAGLALSGATLFGTTEFGGANNSGTLFHYQWDNTPPVSIAQSGTNVIVSWPTDNFPTNNFNFTLESIPQLGGATWNAVSQNTVIVNGHNTVTNPAVGVQFYRLSPF